MDHGTVLGDANKKPVPKNSPMMHCQRRYYQASCAIPKGLIRCVLVRTCDIRTANSAVLICLNVDLFLEIILELYI